MKRFLFFAITFVSCFISHAQNIKEQYNDKQNQQHTIVVKDKAASDEDILKQLDIDQFSMGQQVRITEEMVQKLNQRAKEQASNSTTDVHLQTAIAPVAPLQNEQTLADNSNKNLEKTVIIVDNRKPVAVRPIVQPIRKDSTTRNAAISEDAVKTPTLANENAVAKTNNKRPAGTYKKITPKKKGFFDAWNSTPNSGKTKRHKSGKKYGCYHF